MGDAAELRPADYLPEELFTAVFSLLSPADLGRCNCVSKDWSRRVRRTLILLHNLAFAHIPHVAHRVPVFLSADEDAPGSLRDTTPPSFTAFFNTSDPISELIVCCNGMLLGCTGMPPFYYRSNRCYRFGPPDRKRSVALLHDYVILNPFTGETSAIAIPPCRPFNSLFNFLVFDPRVSPDQFMLISMDDLSSPRPFLYSSATSQWRSLDSQVLTPPQSPTRPRDDCHCVNGIGYKIAGYTSPNPKLMLTFGVPEYQLYANIMAFDVMNESLFWVNSPLLIKQANGSTSQFIGESAGRLSFASVDEKNCLLVWALNDCRSSDWVFRYKIYLNDDQSRPEMVSVFAFHPLDADLVFVSFWDNLFLADLKTMELRDLLHGKRFTKGSLFPFLLPYSLRNK